MGTSGWVYPPWRGEFYPKGLPHRRELEYLSHRLSTAEINGTFYSLQRPERFRQWFEDTPDDFVFAVKGGRFITHLKQLRDVGTPLANFFASGVLALGHKLGPFLWQLPPRMAFDADRLSAFFDELPRTSTAAGRLARGYDGKLKAEPYTKPGAHRPLRHALEVRHPSFATSECVKLLRYNDIGLVVADSAGTWPYLEDVTADFVYLRLHGDKELYASGYSRTALDDWERRIRAWRDGRRPRSGCLLAPAPVRARRDVFAYFDNDVKVHAPEDAIALAERLGTRKAPTS
ncbi:hypothetical protein CFN78_23005 [Amycolatopsis antarctica]|uniref:DUF72 domain-containing protein n=1 Tax=Amycolatopsis antarctica TaxID=1854586 RepID=A0A263CY20_9PSEU|nr:hypothetical protein CFN78_23005 [Amycolatopsis antarctica]